MRKSKQKKPQGKFKRFFKAAYPYIGLLFGFLACSFYPMLEWIDAGERKAVMDQLESNVKDETEKESSWITEMRNQAIAYNQNLAGERPEIALTDIWPYEKQLNTSEGNPPMSFLFIPKISLRMPVYHTTNPEVLAMGAGHAENTSLPIGGNSVHTVISAHSGMVGMSAFDDIRQLKPGDIIGCWTLGDWYCYEVTGSEVIEPTQVDKLTVEKNEDTLTLLTCTPYGVNTHRLLVQARRVPVPEGFAQTKEDPVAVVSSIRIWPVSLATVLIVVTMAIALYPFSQWTRRFHRRMKNNAK